ncbi:hypothetical protein CMV_020668 [Castanea mollissima]|uniref:Reverse transcriptase zinc-binding domain-containing protein n=1 Tax=Castanea mollissima TaxID=60419 RepID=A0A8J4QVK0_9ROSI|nr:hypothetical protein CMV_020668 [Castanea mollissima]
MAAKETLEVGSRWIIGNGRTVNFWRDRWLPSSDSFKVLSPQGHNTGLVKVAQLIDSNTGTWKTELIKEAFLPHEADCILSIPLSLQLPEDSRVWAWSKNGIYTVRSAYRVSLKLLKASTPRTSGDNSDKAKAAQFWKVLWKIDCPNKIKHFLWRACREILPTNYRLAVRKVSNNDRCGFCGECESSGHSL